MRKRFSRVWIGSATLRMGGRERRNVTHTSTNQSATKRTRVYHYFVKRNSYRPVTAVPPVCFPSLHTTVGPMR